MTKHLITEPGFGVQRSGDDDSKASIYKLPMTEGEKECRPCEAPVTESEAEWTERLWSVCKMRGMRREVFDVLVEKSKLLLNGNGSMEDRMFLLEKLVAERVKVKP